MRLLESGEMYIESIYVLSKEKETVRAIDVGEHLGYSKPSVSRALGILREGGFVTVGENGHLSLTESGESIAKKIYERHTILTEMLSALGVDEKTASEDACRLEHAISDESFAAIKKHLEEKR
jgi:Mn-dependent DtxR family transcriptional regulator